VRCGGLCLRGGGPGSRRAPLRRDLVHDRAGFLERSPPAPGPRGGPGLHPGHRRWGTCFWRCWARASGRPPSYCSCRSCWRGSSTVGPSLRLSWDCSPSSWSCFPAPEGGPFTRSADAVVGGVFALIITMLVPRDPRRGPKSGVQDLLEELAAVLREDADALTRSDSTMAWHALIRARTPSRAWRADQQHACGPGARDHLARPAPAPRGAGLPRGSIGSIDLAVRNSRVFSRRLTSVINHAALSDEAIASLSQALEDTADAVTVLSRALAGAHPAERRLNLRQARTSSPRLRPGSTLPDSMSTGLRARADPAVSPPGRRPAGGRRALPRRRRGLPAPALACTSGDPRECRCRRLG
jgi:hypothetical protein